MLERYIKIESVLIFRKKKLSNSFLILLNYNFNFIFFYFLRIRII